MLDSRCSLEVKPCRLVGRAGWGVVMRRKRIRMAARLQSWGMVVPVAEVPLGEINTGTRILSWTF